MPRLILSLCDLSGNWPKFYTPEDGYEVMLVDLKKGQDVRWLYHLGRPVHGILAAPPCTAFARSGAQYWPKKDEDGTTLEGLAIVDACLRAVAIYQPVFWALENPVGRLRRYLGPPRMMFNPCDYGDPYTKKTCLWGEFNIPEKNPVEPVFIRDSVRGRAYSPIHWRTGGKSERTKELRSMTPLGFARAFREANP